MSTFYERGGRVKYLPPKRLLEGLRPSVAIPAVLFAAAVMVAVLFALAKAPREQKWVNLQPQPDWKPGYSEAGEALAADPRFLFEHPFDRARTPTAVRRSGAGEPSASPAAGRAVFVGDSEIVVEHATRGGAARRFARTRWSGFERPATGVGFNLQRGDPVAEGAAVRRELPPGLDLPATDSPAPAIRDPAAGSDLQFAP